MVTDGHSRGAPGVARTSNSHRQLGNHAARTGANTHLGPPESRDAKSHPHTSPNPRFPARPPRTSERHRHASVMSVGYRRCRSGRSAALPYSCARQSHVGAAELDCRAIDTEDCGVGASWCSMDSTPTSCSGGPVFMLWPRKDHRTGNPRSTATAQDRKDNSSSRAAVAREDLDHHAGYVSVLICWVSLSISSMW